jgi:hypothetical protein
MNLQNKQVSIMLHMRFLYPSPENIIQCSSWGDWMYPTKLNSINSRL